MTVLWWCKNAVDVAHSVALIELFYDGRSSMQVRQVYEERNWDIGSESDVGVFEILPDTLSVSLEFD